MATKNLVPRATGEGGIGTSAKRWLEAYINTLYVGSIKNSADTGSILLGGVTSITEDLSLAATHFHVLADCTANDITVTLPDATTAIAGRLYVIHRADTYSALHLMYILNVVTTGGEYIDNEHTSIDLYSDDKTLTLLCTGTGWTIVSLT